LTLSGQLPMPDFWTAYSGLDELIPMNIDSNPVSTR